MKTHPIPKTLRRRQAFGWLVVFAILSAGGRGFADPVVIAPPEVKQRIKGSCTLLHLWAGWCSICLEESMTLIPWFNRLEGAERLVVDVSEAETVDFSTQWMDIYKPEFRTYRKSKERAEDFLKGIDPGIKYMMPYTALYKNGKRIFEAYGRTPTAQIGKLMAKECPVAKGGRRR